MAIYISIYCNKQKHNSFVMARRGVIVWEWPWSFQSDSGGETQTNRGLGAYCFRGWWFLNLLREGQGGCFSMKFVKYGSNFGYLMWSITVFYHTKMLLLRKKLKMLLRHTTAWLPGKIESLNIYLYHFHSLLICCSPKYWKEWSPQIFTFWVHAIWCGCYVEEVRHNKCVFYCSFTYFS